ncbi:unnamed protein product (macronuclear) [Paramecium tetraurelia]|uniref:Uncharacterized protein n=1 Tax=Paramecium tetraurelia TaxID=5888 RepID=A0CZA9_PARTE|nr:uncharacterized protein GSPATT00011699001 [Paramecium tetraurelia]CAK76126.1 unnamed protein product [Paramecium tetraurelia]|eukprot:XP_001443523.1 hypothetical protein (macronuclear) [Paramecium tetraurelia strain d4-2]
MLRLAFKQLSRQSFSQKMKIYELLFERGQKFFNLNQYQNAIDQLETCMSVFADAKQSKRWEDTKFEDLNCRHYPEQQQIKVCFQDLWNRLFELMGKCYYVLHEQAACTKMCDYWQQLNPLCAGAFILRAQVLNFQINKSRFLSEQVTQLDCQMICKDLKFAQQLDPLNEGITKVYEMVKTQLKRFEEQDSDKELYDQQDTTQYDVYEDEELPQDFMAQFAYQDNDQELSYELDPKKPIPKEVQELGRFIETRGMEMVKTYQQNGQIKEAEDLKDKLQKALIAKKQLEKISQLDFNRPKKKLYQFAQKFGIDLLDPQVQNEFKRIQEQNLEDIREWLKQNQWSIVDKATQIQQQEKARQELAKLQFKRKMIPQKVIEIRQVIFQHAKHKCIKKVALSMHQNSSSPLTMNKSVSSELGSVQLNNSCNILGVQILQLKVMMNLFVI